MSKTKLFLALLVPAYAWLLFALFYLDNPNQHGGHRQAAFRSCLTGCHCEAPSILWSCQEECEHRCALADSELRFAEGRPQVKYGKGRWAFYRVAHCTEFWSALFSLLNGLPYAYFLLQGYVHPMGNVLDVSAGAHCITWLLSMLFHANTCRFFEDLDYLGVVLTCLAELSTVLLRLSSCRWSRWALPGSAGCLAGYGLLGAVLGFPWQLQATVAQGLLGLTAALWIWYGVRERQRALTKHLALPWAVLITFCSLELVDVAPFTLPWPFFGHIDSHSLWHLVTVPVNLWIVYGWVLETTGRRSESRPLLRAVLWSSVFVLLFSTAILPSWLDAGRVCQNRPQCARLLRDTWLLPMDLSDPQWRAFRERLPLLAAALGFLALLRARLLPTPARRARAALALGFAAVLHGPGALVFLACLLAVAAVRRGAVRVFISWFLALALLYLKDADWAALPGGLHDWRAAAKYVALRLVSVAADWKDQTLAQVVDYFFHPALWLAGPIMCFQDFAAQEGKGKMPWGYAARWALMLLLQELLLMVAPFFALTKTGVSFLSPRQYASLLYGAITGLWLKFALLWRFFRTFALVEGLQPPENLPHCINTHLTLTGFWQSWHCSFNRWVVRYIYVPLGGRRWKFLNVWVIFLFSAVWHDVSASNWQPLFLWGLLNVLHLSMEWSVQEMWRSRMAWVKDWPCWLLLQGLAGALTSACIA
ncbi:unnamed protein product, partial [Effrenium voratum]